MDFLIPERDSLFERVFQIVEQRCTVIFVKAKRNSRVTEIESERGDDSFSILCISLSGENSRKRPFTTAHRANTLDSGTEDFHVSLSTV